MAPLVKLAPPTSDVLEVLRDCELNFKLFFFFIIDNETPETLALFSNILQPYSIEFNALRTLTQVM